MQMLPGCLDTYVSAVKRILYKNALAGTVGGQMAVERNTARLWERSQSTGCSPLPKPPAWTAFPAQECVRWVWWVPGVGTGPLCGRGPVGKWGAGPFIDPDCLVSCLSCLVSFLQLPCRFLCQVCPAVALGPVEYKLHLVSAIRVWPAAA